MIRAPKLVPSRPMYAFNPATWRKASYGGFEVDAVWFKRKRGVIVATMGTYHPFVCGHGAEEPDSGEYLPWIEAANDNRYGGSWLAKWDGTGLLCYDPPVSPDVAAERIKFLTAVLAGFPDPPADLDGWWTFPR